MIKGQRIILDNTNFGASKVGPFTKKLVELAKQVYARQNNTLANATGGIVVTGQPMAGKKYRLSLSPTQSVGIAPQSIAPSPWPASMHKIGDKVLVSQGNATFAKSGQITALRVNHSVWSYDIQYNDGTVEIDVHENRISGNVITASFSVSPSISQTPVPNPNKIPMTGSGGWYYGGLTYNYNPATPNTTVFNKGTTVNFVYQTTFYTGTIICSYQCQALNCLAYDILCHSGITYVNIPESAVTLLSVCLEQPFDYEITNNVESKVCTCSTLDLMAYGCKCGSFQREQARSAAN
jgi:hypothetical protein